MRLRVRTLLAALVMIVTAVGCYQTGGRPKTASVSVEASPAEPLLLIVSTRFELDPGGGIVYANQDSILITGAFSNTYQLNDEARFTARLSNPTAATESVRIRVHIDGDLEYDREAQLPAGEYLQYVYRFSLDNIS